MNKTQVVKLDEYSIEFDNGMMLVSEHESDCCEHHWLDFTTLSIEDFKGLEFDLSTDSFFTRIPDYGIELNPIKGHSVRIAGYGSNNGYYSSELTLFIYDGKGFSQRFDITDCQVIEGE